METLKNSKSWQIDKLTLRGFTSSMSKVRGERGDWLHSEGVVCLSSRDLSIQPVMETLKNFKSWQIEKLTLGQERGRYTSSMSKVEGERGDRLNSEEVRCYSNSDLSILCHILGNCRQWSLGMLYLCYYPETISANSWSTLAAVAGRGKIDKVRVWKWDVQQGKSEDVDAVKRITQKWVEL